MKNLSEIPINKFKLIPTNHWERNQENNKLKSSAGNVRAGVREEVNQRETPAYKLLAVHKPESKSENSKGKI